MGMPACTITSQTAHGGIVILGYPTVLIGMMPASRIGDNHVCPMVTGIVPHVGGPFILGSPTVLVGEMPQSRVTDELVCVGPPDVAVMGCETVLVGMAGGAGAAGAAAGIAAMGVSVPAAPPPAGSNSTQAVVQYDGTVNTWSPAGTNLPPITLSQTSWPDLPAEKTATFSSVGPVTLPQGTQLFALADSESDSVPSFWSTAPPQVADPGKDLLKVLTVADPAGMKAWAGQAAAENLAQNAENQARHAVAQAQQNLQGVIQQAQKQMQAAQAQLQQTLSQAEKAMQQAQQQGQQAIQQAQQQVQQAQQQAQQAAKQAQQAAQQAQQQAQQAAGQAQKSATQVCTSAASTASQTVQNFSPPFKG